MKTVLVFCCIAFAAITAVSQQPAVDRGQPEELKGVTRIYVSAGSNSARNNIVKQIKRKLPQLTVTNSAGEAEVWLVFSSDRRSFSKGNPGSGLAASAASSSTESYEVVGTGAVIKPITKSSAHRLIDFKDTTDTTTSASELLLSTEFAKAFVKAYRKANP
jgi:hypothetical protein